MARHNRYSKEYYETDPDSLRLLWEMTENIRTVRELKKFLETLPTRYADVRHLLERALDFFAETKVCPDGRRNGKKIWEHLQLGYGPRLTDRAPITPKLLMGLMTWVFRDSPVPLSRSMGKRYPIQIVRNRRYPHGYALDLLDLLDTRLRGGTFK